MALAKKKSILHFFFKLSISCRLQVASCVYIYDYCKKEHFYQVTPSCFLPNPVAASIDKARDEIVSGILGQFKGNELEIVGKRKRWHNCHKRMFCKNCNILLNEICQYVVNNMYCRLYYANFHRLSTYINC